MKAGSGFFPNSWKEIDAKWLSAILCVGLVVALRVLYILHYRIDSDEPQHLHVVWGWTHGLLPYRDLFDNHTPVFQALCAPLFWLLGVRADIVLPMRMAMLPIYAGTIYCVARIVATFASPRTALWSAGLAAVFPPFFLSSIEFRPDQLWTLVWLVTLAVLVCGPIAPRRAFGAGVLLGLAFAVSMKSVLLLIALGGALVGTFLIRGSEERRGSEWRLLGKCAAAGLAGLIIVPSLVALVFYLMGAGPDMYYCVIQHNIIPGDPDGHNGLKAVTKLACWLPVAVIGWVAIGSMKLPTSIKRRVCFCFLAAACYYIFLVSFWPVLTVEDYLPFFPSAALVIGPLLILGNVALIRKIGFAVPPSPILLLLVELAVLVWIQSPLIDQTQNKIGMVADTLLLTSESDFVMDSKGETIYRRRPFYYVLERMSMWHLKNGKIDDTIVQRLIETRTPLVTMRRMPAAVRQFMRENYVAVGFRLRVLGKKLPPASLKSHAIAFELVIPARYMVVTVHGPAQGTLDGTTLSGPRELAAGRHEFQFSNAKDEPVMVVWANAWDHGYSPFAEIEESHPGAED